MEVSGTGDDGRCSKAHPSGPAQGTRSLMRHVHQTSSMFRVAAGWGPRRRHPSPKRSAASRSLRSPKHRGKHFRDLSRPLHRAEASYGCDRA
ncbi:hypothetical protein BHE74_00045411 [Ensete ventricosum]|nr:hypothetical protein BHE74_00045411 [Ensete ventricosum]RZS23910.1 hypothetical protein BHM03_00056920 [Ensete ventricosum]